MKNLEFLPIFALVFLTVPMAYGDTIKQTMEGSMDIEITYPDESIIERNVSISVFVKNNGWEDKQDISFVFSNQDNSIIPVSSNKITLDTLSEGGSYGSNIDFRILPTANIGINFLNIRYSQILLVNNEEPQKPIFRDIAIPLIIKDKPGVTIHANTPESIFTNAEFPFEVEVVSEDIDISNVSIQIMPPRDIEFRGKTLHTFSSIQKDVPVGITSRIITPTEEVNTEYKMPFQILVTYTDDVGEEIIDSQTVSLVLRPRTFMELTTDGGIWIGDFFIAPYVSIGTIIGIPAGTLFSLAIRRKQKSKEKDTKSV